MILKNSKSKLVLIRSSSFLPGESQRHKELLEVAMHCGVVAMMLLLCTAYWDFFSGYCGSDSSGLIPSSHLNWNAFFIVKTCDWRLLGALECLHAQIHTGSLVAKGWKCKLLFTAFVLWVAIPRCTCLEYLCTYTYTGTLAFSILHSTLNETHQGPWRKIQH